MIEFANNSDKENIISLWKESFDDSRSYIENFLNNYSIKNALVYRTDNQIISMLFLIPCKLVVLGEEYNAAYIYAACTESSYRNRGYMSALIEAAKNIVHDFDFLLLSPADNSLYDFYLKFGFKYAFKEKIISINRKHMKMISDIDNGNNINYSLEELRDKVLQNSDYVKWDNKHIKYALNDNNYILDSNGYIVYCEEQGKCIIKEICPVKQGTGKLLGSLMSKTNCENFEFRLPVLYPFTHQNELIQSSGLLYCLNPELNNISNSICSAYLGLKLD